MEVSWLIIPTPISFIVCSCAVKATVNGAGSLKGKRMRVRGSKNGQKECTSAHTEFTPKYSHEQTENDKEPTDNDDNPIIEDDKAASEDTTSTEDTIEDALPDDESKVSKDTVPTVNSLPFKDDKVDEELEAVDKEIPDKEANPDEEPVSYDDELPDKKAKVDQEPTESGYSLETGENDSANARSSAEEDENVLEGAIESEPAAGGKLTFKKNSHSGQTGNY